MYTKNLTVKELFSTLDADYVRGMFKEGLRSSNDRLAISAMEELLTRGEVGNVMEDLNEAFANGSVPAGSIMIKILGHSLLEAREHSPLLPPYGKALLRGACVGPGEWIANNPPSRKSRLGSQIGTIEAGAPSSFGPHDITPPGTFHDGEVTPSNG